MSIGHYCRIEDEVNKIADSCHSPFTGLDIPVSPFEFEFRAC